MFETDVLRGFAPCRLIGAMATQESPVKVTGGKTPSEYMFSELPQVADIARRAFSILPTPSYCGSLRSGSERLHDRLRKNTTRLSRIDWLWLASRASVWVTGGSRCRVH